jgi:hypothetical protein
MTRTARLIGELHRVKWTHAILVPDASSCIGNRRPHSREILSGIDANDGKHHSTILDELSNDARGLDRLIEIS